MQMAAIPFDTTDWSSVEPTRHAGEAARAVDRNQAGFRV